MLLFDFVCNSGHKYEELVQSGIKFISCPTCGKQADRQFPTPRIDYLRMGLDPSGCPTAGEKWAKMQTAKGRGEKSKRFSQN